MTLPPAIAEKWNWQLRARCRSMPVVMFFSADNASRYTKIITEQSAKAVCVQCPVQVECLDHASEAGGALRGLGRPICE